MADVLLSRIPPSNIDAERSVLGAVLIEGRGTLATVIEQLTVTDFFTDQHRCVYSAMRTLFERGDAVDLITLQEELRRVGDIEAVGGPAALSLLMEQGAISAFVPQYVQIVKDMSFRRQLIVGCSTLITSAFDATAPASTLAERSEQMIFGLTERQVTGKAVRMNEALRESFNVIEKSYEEKNPLTGLTTGFTSLDVILGGLQPTDLIIVAGRPAMGKSAFALSLVAAAAAGGAKVLVMSLEMSTLQLTLRMLCSEARVDSQAVKSGFLSSSDWMRLTNAANRLSGMQIFFDDASGISVTEARAKARRIQVEFGLDLVVVDYLQLMRGSGRSREQEIAEITRGMKAMAKELRVPVVALSQLSRAVEARVARDYRPQLSDLRESGAIEQDADVVMFLYRASVYRDDMAPEDRNLAEVIVGKQRNGPIGTVRVVFLPQYARFENLADGREEPGREDFVRQEEFQ